MEYADDSKRVSEDDLERRRLDAAVDTVMSDLTKWIRAKSLDLERIARKLSNARQRLVL